MGMFMPSLGRVPVGYVIPAEYVEEFRIARFGRLSIHSERPMPTLIGSTAFPQGSIRKGATCLWAEVDLASLRVGQTLLPELHLESPCLLHGFQYGHLHLAVMKYGLVRSDELQHFLDCDDRILIDVSRQVPVPPGIFVIWDGMGLVTKRIEHVPHSEPPRVVIKSANPEYDSYERLVDEIRIVGRAV